MTCVALEAPSGLPLQCTSGMGCSRLHALNGQAPRSTAAAGGRRQALDSRQEATLPPSPRPTLLVFQLMKSFLYYSVGAGCQLRQLLLRGRAGAGLALLLLWLG